MTKYYKYINQRLPHIFLNVGVKKSRRCEYFDIKNRIRFILYNRIIKINLLTRFSHARSPHGLNSSQIKIEAKMGEANPPFNHPIMIFHDSKLSYLLHKHTYILLYYQRIFIHLKYYDLITVYVHV